MYKLGVVWRYKIGFDRAEARARWAAHAKLTAAIPGLDKYTINFALDKLGLLGIDVEQTKFDGYACLWFADQAAFEAARHTPEWAAGMFDSDEFLDNTWIAGMGAVVEENVVIDGPEGPFKAVWICRFNDEIRADAAKTAEAHEYWKRTHGGAYGVEVPGIGRYVQNHNVAPLNDAQPGFDGFSECWFEDRAAFDVTMAAPEWDEMNNDAFNLFDVEGFIVNGYSALIDEVRIKG